MDNHDIPAITLLIENESRRQKLVNILNTLGYSLTDLSFQLSLILEIYLNQM